MSCSHQICGNTQKVWLPYEVRGDMKGLKPHPYCLQCGAVKNTNCAGASPRPQRGAAYGGGNQAFTL